MINNIDIIKSIISFDTPDEFYHLQILKRKKEHPSLGSNSYVVKTYYISSMDYLDKKLPEIIALCDFHNARAYINLNGRSFERTAFHTLKKITDQIMNKDFKSVRKAYESVCGEFGTGKDKGWIIDIDTPKEELDTDVVVEMLHFLEGIEPIGNKFICELPTKNGFHLITKPFNVQKFSEKYTAIDVHKNNPTLLFIP